MNRPPFTTELAGLPVEISAELEDHLMESLEAGLRSGMSLDDARQSALRSLGNPGDISRHCLNELNPKRPQRTPLTLQRVAIAGWLLLGIGFATRVCVASDPSHASIVTCVGLSIGSLTLGLLLRRAWVPMQRLGAAVSILLAAVSAGAIVQTDWHPWIQSSLALSPAILSVFALFGALSAGALTAAFRRPIQAL